MEKAIHEQGLVSVLRQLHDNLDTAVFAAYGWPGTLTDAEILERLVALNAVRAALADCNAPATAADIARRFARLKPPAVEEILQTLVTLGQARSTAQGAYQCIRGTANAPFPRGVQ